MVLQVLAAVEDGDQEVLEHREVPNVEEPNQLNEGEQ